MSGAMPLRASSHGRSPRRRYVESMPAPVPQAAITFDAETGCCGFSVWMPGKRPHYVMDTFTTEDAARNWLDPWRERVWEDTLLADAG